MVKGLPEKLKQLRQQYKYSQRELAKKLGVSPASIAAYETGERSPNLQNLLAFSRLFHCSTDYLLGNYGASAPDAIMLNVVGLSDKQIKLLGDLIDSIKADRSTNKSTHKK